MARTHLFMKYKNPEGVMNSSQVRGDGVNSPAPPSSSPLSSPLLLRSRACPSPPSSLATEPRSLGVGVPSPRAQMPLPTSPSPPETASSFEAAALGAGPAVPGGIAPAGRGAAGATGRALLLLLLPALLGAAGRGAEGRTRGVGAGGRGAAGAGGGGGGARRAAASAGTVPAGSAVGDTWGGGQQWQWQWQRQWQWRWRRWWWAEAATVGSGGVANTCQRTKGSRGRL